MHTDLTKRLDGAIQNLITSPDLSDQYSDALQAYRDDLSSSSKDALCEILLAMSLLTDPIDEILAQAWAEALSLASRKGLIRGSKRKLGVTVFSNIWMPLKNEGWDALPGYRQEQLTSALGQTTRNTTFSQEAIRSVAASDIAKAMLNQIANGTIPKGTCCGDLTINFVDGVRLNIRMNNWRPVLGSKKHPPRQMRKDAIYAAPINIPSGRIIVSDMIGIPCLTDLLFELIDNYGININYSLHRISRTAYAASELDMIDVAMSQESPGLVQSAKGGSVFVGASSKKFQCVAPIAHDYAGMNIIDRNSLTEKISKGLGLSAADAEAMIDAYLADDENAWELSVNPGVWHFYWDDDGRSLNKAFIAAGIDAPKHTTFALSPIAYELGSRLLDFGKT